MDVVNCDLIGFAGVIGSGKDYNASRLEGLHFTRVDFADAVRETLWLILGWKPKNQAEYEEFKTTVVSFRLKFSLPKLLTGRELLINIGDGFRKNYGENYWVDIAERKIKLAISAGKKIVVSDVRYSNEVKMLTDLGGKVFFANYKSERYNSTYKSDSEYMSQALLAKGFGDMDEIRYEDVRGL
jgi:hypothetical protein